MTPKSHDVHTNEEFIKELEATSEQVKNLLVEIRESEIDFAQFKTELRILCENVKNLSAVLYSGDGSSLVTKVALIEQKMALLEKDLQKEIDSNEEAKVADKTGKWQLRAAMATGILGLLATVVNMIIETMK